jgi:hypothetical protein
VGTQIERTLLENDLDRFVELLPPENGPEHFVAGLRKFDGFSEKIDVQASFYLKTELNVVHIGVSILKIMKQHPLLRRA